MDFSLRLITPATDQAVSTAEAREHLRIDDAEDDAKIGRAIAAATKIFERFTRRALMPQTWLLETADLVRGVELPRPPLIEVVEVNGRSRIDDDWEAIALEDCWIEANRSPARIRFADRQLRLVQITYEAGYENAEAIDEDYKLTILQLVTFDYENRGDVDAKWPIALRALLDSQRSGSFAGLVHL